MIEFIKIWAVGALAITCLLFVVAVISALCLEFDFTAIGIGKFLLFMFCAITIPLIIGVVITDHQEIKDVIGAME